MNGRFRENLQEAPFLLGSWVGSSDPGVMEAMAGSELDFIVIDSEHGPLGPDTVQLLTMAAARFPTAVLVRVGGTETIRLMQPLDAGADGIIVPRIQSAGEVESVVEATRYPPDGLRGYGPRRAGGYGRDEAEYVTTADKRVAVIVQIETAGAIDDLEAIARVPGLDGLLVGRNDLSASMGLARQPNHPEVHEVIDRVVQVCADAGIAAGIAGPADPEEALRWRDLGMRFFSAGGDIGFLVQSLDRFVADVRA
ncbi:MAG: HpcH/HpaI aldolase/citrate lyase family protein [Acidimicrobiia bacterium]